jgi:hypothetical protein
MQLRWAGKSWAGQGLPHNLCRCVLIRPPVNTIAVNHRVIVRILFGEPNFSATSFLRLLVNGRQASIPQNGRYLRNKDTLWGALMAGLLAPNTSPTLIRVNFLRLSCEGQAFG